MVIIIIILYPYKSYIYFNLILILLDDFLNTGTTTTITTTEPGHNQSVSEEVSQYVSSKAIYPGSSSTTTLSAHTVTMAATVTSTLYGILKSLDLGDITSTGVSSATSIGSPTNESREHKPDTIQSAAEKTTAPGITQRDVNTVGLLVLG